MNIKGSKLEIKNYINIFLWVFTAIWVVFACIFLYLYQRDYNTLDATARLIIPFITVGGIFTLVPFSMSKFILKITFDNNSETIFIKKVKPFNISQISFKYELISRLEIEETKDSEGDPYFNLNLYLKNDEFYTIKEGHHLDKLEDVKQTIIKFMKNEE